MKSSLNIICAICLALGFSFNAAHGSNPVPEKQFADKVNLALRQVGHQLLVLAGDDHSTIAPVKQHGPLDFELRLEKAFNYDTLPQLLHQAFLDYSITSDYRVVIEPCEEDIPVLGYNLAAFTRNDVPCRGRELQDSCHRMLLTLTAPIQLIEPALAAKSKMGTWPWIFGLLGVGLLLYFQYRKRTNEYVAQKQVQDDQIALGKFKFDHRNQLLVQGDIKQELTFRENKLLLYFASNFNEILTRDQLVDEVWGDEGVMVGRSLDVFISRLRKLLKGDDQVAIKNIHGVGYRLEIAVPST
jgi:DNA-binding winged helix-turn-helix (wHTH) protein